MRICLIANVSGSSAMSSNHCRTLSATGAGLAAVPGVAGASDALNFCSELIACGGAGRCGARDERCDDGERDPAHNVSCSGLGRNG